MPLLRGPACLACLPLSRAAASRLAAAEHAPYYLLRMTFGRKRRLKAAVAKDPTPSRMKTSGAPMGLRVLIDHAKNHEPHSGPRALPIDPMVMLIPFRRPRPAASTAALVTRKRLLKDTVATTLVTKT
eukprot:scaffold1396_cov252-Pinguiococcus_pyrenoidosus.AAC.10